MSIRFGKFTLDLEARQLMQASREVRLTPKAFELLAMLLQERPKALSKTDLQQRLWADTFVVEANLSNLIAEIREALGDDAKTPMFIRTAHRFGYAFCGEATILTDPDETGAYSPSCWLEWNGRRMLLLPGENTIGRDPEAEVHLDSSTVSRHHARIIVSKNSATLEDLGSKNGTTRGIDGVHGPVSLADGDAIRIGSVVVTFHLRDPLASTETQVKTRA